MSRWDAFWFSPGEAVRPRFLLPGFLVLLALDAWTQMLAGGARYGTAGLNVSHFAWLDAVQPVPTPGLYVGLMLAVGWLAAFAATTGPAWPTLAALCALYTWGWAMSILDGYQHHYLISLVLLCLVFFPRAWAWRLLGFTVAGVYGFAAVAKLDPGWRSGRTLAQLVPGDAGWPWSLLAHGAIAIEVAIALGYALALLPPHRKSRWIRRACGAAWALALTLHASFWLMGLWIGWFGAYMVLLATVYLAPESSILWAGRAARRVEGWRRNPDAIGLPILFASAVLFPLAAGAMLELPGGVRVGAAAAVFGATSAALAWRRGDLALARRRAVAGAVAGAAMFVVVSASTMRFEYHALRAEEYARPGQLDEARVAYGRAFAYRAPSTRRRSLAHNNLARLLEDPDEAIAHYRRAVEIDPLFAPAHANLGSALATRGEPRQALAHLREAARLQPRAAAPWNGLAWFLATQSDPALRDPAEAVLLAERAVRLSPEPRAEILDTLAVAYAASGDFARALTTAWAALGLASPELAAEISMRIQRFEAGMPWVEPEASAGAMH